MQKEQYIGIDFGTTNTAVVLVEDDEFGRSKPKYLGENGNYPFSSIVAIPKDDGELLFGREVRESRESLSETHEIFTSMKSYLGKEVNEKKFYFNVNGKRYSPKYITKAFLLHIKEHIKQSFGIDINEASFAFPMDFSPQARRDLLEAANEAGIVVKSFVSESTAAYIANREEGRSFSRVMVLDWGGGTLDISVLQLSGNNIREISVWGDHIGGDDIDIELAERIHSLIVIKSGISGGRFEDMTSTDKDKMITQSEDAKISISEDEDDYIFIIRNYGEYGTATINISVDQFNAIIEPIIRGRVLKAIDNALDRGGGLTPESIDAVVIVGGSSNIKSYENSIMNLFKNARIFMPDDVQWSTATGAALMQVAGIELVLSEEIGVLLSDDTVFPVLPERHAVGNSITPITFSLNTDDLNAHFIFTNNEKNLVYEKCMVPTKGFLREKLVLKAEITKDQVAKINISNGNFENDDTVLEINKLKFHYDISNLNPNDDT